MLRPACRFKIIFGCQLASASPGHLFTASTCAVIAAIDAAEVLGPSRHGYTDAAHFGPAVPGAGRRMDHCDLLLAELRKAFGDADWTEGGFRGYLAASPRAARAERTWLMMISTTMAIENQSP